jgi:hypothetical protein
MHNEPLRWTRTSYRLVNVRRKDVEELLSRNKSCGLGDAMEQGAPSRAERAIEHCASSSKKIGPSSKMGACDAFEPHC